MGASYIFIPLDICEEVVDLSKFLMLRTVRLSHMVCVINIRTLS